LQPHPPPWLNCVRRSGAGPGAFIEILSSKETGETPALAARDETPGAGADHILPVDADQG
jgi:hypothetical protein